VFAVKRKGAEEEVDSEVDGRAVGGRGVGGGGSGVGEGMGVAVGGIGVGVLPTPMLNEQARLRSNTPASTNKTRVFM